MERNARSPQELFCMGYATLGFSLRLPRGRALTGGPAVPFRRVGAFPKQRWGRDEVGRPLQSVAFRMAPAG